MTRAHRLCFSLLTALLLGSALAPAGPAAAAAPVFAGSIPPIMVEAGFTNGTVLDFGPYFSDPDGDGLSFMVLDLKGSIVPTESVPPRPLGRPDCCPRFVLDGTRLKVSSYDALEWGRLMDIRIAASDGFNSASSNAIPIYITPPPAMQRTWVSRATWAFGVTTNENHNSSCTPFDLHMDAVPTDAYLVEYSTTAWRSLRDPPEPGPPGGNTTAAPPPSPPASTVTIGAELWGVEVMNETIGYEPQRIHLNESLLRDLIDNATPEAGMVILPINWTFCIFGGSSDVRTNDTRMTMVRLPPGADRTNPNPNSPMFSGELGTVELTSGSSTTASFAPGAGFSDADGDPLAYAVLPSDPGAALTAGITVSADEGGLHFSSSNASWTGDLDFIASAKDPFGAGARSNAFRLHVVAPPPPTNVAQTGGTIAADEAVAVVVIVAAAAVVVTFEAARYLLLAAVFGLLAARGRRPSLLDHFLRGQIFQIIKDNPGIHYMEIRRRTDLANGTVSHHLRVLEKGGLVRVVHDGTKTRFYDTGEKPDEHDYGLTPSDRQVLDLVAQTPGIDQLALATQAGLSKSRVNRSVSRLALLGLLTKARSGRSVLLYPRTEPVPAATRPFPDATD